MRIARKDIKFIVCIPTSLIFALLFLQRRDNTFVLSMLVSLGILALLWILESIVEKADNYEVMTKNFNRIEINELNKKLEKKNEKIEFLTNQLEDLKRENIQNSIKQKELKELFDEITNAYIETTIALSGAFELKGDFEHGHSRRVMDIACEIGRRLDISNRDIEVLRYSAILHDIGKLEISDTIINNPNELDSFETNQMKKHPLVAYGILEEIDFLRNSAEVIVQHHERYDGGGYPYGLEGEKINRLSRILTLTDAFEAMISERAYKKSKTMFEALLEIKENKGKQFDPEVADVLIGMIEETYEEYKEGNDNETGDKSKKYNPNL